MRKHLLLLSILLGLCSGLSAQRVLTASGTYTYYAPSNLTLDQAKSIALERAKTQIIANNFGTVVGVMNHTRVENEAGDSSISFLSLGESEVKGEWIETLGKPVFQISYQENLQVVKVTIRGMIREIVASVLPLEVRVLRNGISDRYESDSFRDGDEFYLSFKSPVDGYVSVFLYGKDGVNRLIPLKHEKAGSRSVEAGIREVFFARRVSRYDVAQDKVMESIRSEYVLTCDGENELDRIYVVFSPNQFAHPNDHLPEAMTEPAQLSFEDFQRWLSKSRRQDSAMTVVIRDILIKK